MKIWQDGFTFSKRQIGLLMFIGGALGAVGLLVIDSLRPTADVGIGPAQELAIIGMVIISIIGLTLIPLGDKPV